MDAELLWSDATAQAALVASGEVAPLELVDAAIERIEALDPLVNAVVIRRFEMARRAAAGPLPDGPFRGVPFLLKDLGALEAGGETHQGMRALRDARWKPRTTAHSVTALRNAGVVVLGRTNVPELGTLPTTEPLAHGPTHNPYDLTRTAGGSSGGSAAAVAAGFVAAAHGSDGGGSIRIPASACGLVGLKPARGRVSAGPQAGEGWAGFSTQGVLTRSVRDAATFLDVLAERHLDDPYVAPLPERPFAEELGRPPGRLRIGLSVAAPEGVAVDSSFTVGLERVGKLLEALGHDVSWQPVGPLADAEFMGHFVNLIAAAVAADVAHWGRELGRQLGPDDLEPVNAFYAELGGRLSAATYYASREWLHGFARGLLTWWRGADNHSGSFDLLVTPTLALPPPSLGWLVDPDEGGARVPAFVPFTPAFNATGQPALSLPLLVTESGLPVGVQLVGPPFGEAVLLRLAASLEEAAPWAGRRPLLEVPPPG